MLAERDPAPPAPALPRPDRDPTRGTPLWRLVDLRPDVDGAEAALLEAALEASGLLDAQVLADGSLRAGPALDTVVVAGSPVAGPSLADVLRAEPSPDSPVPADVVTAVLAAVALVDRVDADTGAPSAVGRDGSWRLGALTGRATKPLPQYVGASARAAERVRRLDEVETALAAVRAEAAEAQTLADGAVADLAALQAWADAQPDSTELAATWTRHDERSAAHDRARSVTAQRHRALAEATAELATLDRELHRLCAEQHLPDDLAALDARAAELDRLDATLAALAEEAARLLDAARRLEEDEETAERDAADARDAAAAAAEAAQLARDAAAESEALLATLGVEVARLQEQLAGAREQARGARRDAAAAGARVTELTGTVGGQRAHLEAAQLRLAEAEPDVADQAGALAALRTVPGLVEAALDGPLTDDHAAALDGLAALPPAGPAMALPTRWAALVVERPADANTVHAELRTLAVGPAAETEPRVVPVAGHLTVLGRDRSGAERPLTDLAVTLAAEVAREQELLTERERAIFEEHLLGELGDALRSRRQEALDLVHGMNDLLADVKTSQGIRVRLQWDLRDDAGPDVRDAVGLLGRARGSLTPEESTRLRDTLGGLIELQRASEPEQGYAEHLARALDYRRWSAFAVRLQRPGTDGWTTLTRRTPLSQGEQKVVCYLPLFAAAAAHFTSVAGAAPHAPRLILLDDAFPKIDVRTHPLLFGLLVDLDLDFVLTSERLWGDHDSVPSLAIYEALRRPGEPGIAQYRYTWDGQTLTGQG